MLERAGRAGEHDHLAGDLAGAAHRALVEVGQALEGADDLVAPARLAGLVVVAGVLAELGAEDVARELGEVVAVQDELVSLVDLRELAATRTEEQQVGDEHRAGEDRRRQTVGAGQVVPLEHLLAQ
ncbi:MAG: hypothetical protein JNM72_12970 [Deltaproteobacteria bacterium]|jgi:hypothetical protein|nr:hypothetical protein [Deltaproteobacteria bacterium]